ncbi:hypothetical protein [Acidipropionibacterium jensenii]|uniref:hypothetical protein n=1 Tax=Acidipropionibacterium jensenii TaxID=1749 RepID=UPI002649DF26|nr:hypothetical protein [Acidipropionibacterium jensenii]MDN5997321.1 hypothetical protein [Acidipropionibacterium jensenii]MDN6655814.1 hypothetical protein [Bifidobacterium crudilactis]
MLTVTEDDTKVSRADVARIINATNLTNLRVDEVKAGPVKAAPDTINAGIVNKKVAFGSPQGSDVLLVRVEHTLSCRDKDETEIASVTFAHILTFHLTTDLKTSRAAVSAWIDTNVYYMVYPYVRQFFTEMTSALGLPPVVLDYLHRNDLESHTISEGAPVDSASEGGK